MNERPLVVVTRDEPADGRLTAALAARGLAAFSLQTVATRPGTELQRLDALLSEIAPRDWLAFSSAQAVDVVCERAAWRKLVAGRRPKLAVVGPATAARLRDTGAEPDIVAERQGAGGLAEALLASAELAGVHVVWPRSDRARPELAERLRERGARVSEVVVYRTTPVTSPALAEFRQLLAAGRLAAVTFLSPSSALGLATALGASDLGLLAGRALVASIGPTTSDALRALRAPPQLEAATPSVEALADALAASLIGAKT